MQQGVTNQGATKYAAFAAVVAKPTYSRLLRDMFEHAAGQVEHVKSLSVQLRLPLRATHRTKATADAVAICVSSKVLLHHELLPAHAPHSRR